MPVALASVIAALSVKYFKGERNLHCAIPLIVAGVAYMCVVPAVAALVLKAFVPALFMTWIVHSYMFLAILSAHPDGCMRGGAHAHRG